MDSFSEQKTQMRVKLISAEDWLAALRFLSVLTSVGVLMIQNDAQSRCRQAFIRAQ